ncbi:hypothetical protein AAVH_27293 [Aphelenchoides avenae]|nr:hypothetical protein AAVH_27293 [Aphelenchus avenae]
MFQAQTEVGSFEHPCFLQFPCRWYSVSRCLETNVGLEASDAHVDYRNIARFYPGPETTFDKHVMRVSNVYKVSIVENSSGQRIFVVASDDNASMMDGK